VFVIRRDPDALQTLRQLLERKGVSVKTYRSGKAFLERLPPAPAGCILSDVGLPGMDGLELQKRLAARRVRLPIIFLSPNGDIPTCVRAMKAGAFHYLQELIDEGILLELVGRALDVDQLRRQVAAEQAEIASRLERLTSRERQVMDLMCVGKSVKLISLELGISYQTAAKHCGRVLAKLKVASAAELIRLVAGQGDRPVAASSPLAGSRATASPTSPKRLTY
jgi:FixJ family two-component response regulator